MPAKRKRQNGKGFLDVLKTGFNFLKDTKAISKIAGLIPDPRAKGVAAVAGGLGFGRKKRAPRKQKGSGFLDFIPGVGPMLSGILGFGKKGRKAKTGGRKVVPKKNLF